MSYIMVILNVIVSFVHLILTYIVFIVSLISNDVKILFILFILMTFIKYLYYLFGRCILTLYEYNDNYSSMASLLSKTLTRNLDDKETEEVLINLGLLIILNKLFVLMFAKYFKITI